MVYIVSEIGMKRRGGVISIKINRFENEIKVIKRRVII
jgi:hypothetical protein